MGAITDNVRKYVPATYLEMVENGDPALYSVADLQALADFVKFTLFGVIVPEDQEAIVYPPIVILFMAKLTTIRFIPSAIDYWDNQLASESLAGTQESLNFRDHLAGLQSLYKMLKEEVQADWVVISPLVGGTGTQRLTPKVSYGDNGRGVLITPDPQLFPPAYSKDEILFSLIPWV